MIAVARISVGVATVAGGFFDTHDHAISLESFDAREMLDVVRRHQRDGCARAQSHHIAQVMQLGAIDDRDAIDDRMMQREAGRAAHRVTLRSKTIVIHPRETVVFTSWNSVA